MVASRLSARHEPSANPSANPSRCLLPRRPHVAVVQGRRSLLVLLFLLGAASTACGRRHEQERQEQEPQAQEPPPVARADREDGPGSPGGTPAPAAGLPSAEAPESAPFLRRITAEELLELGKRRGTKGFLVNAWASWCGPCKEEFPMLVRLRPSLAALGIALEFVSMDGPESEEAALKFARDQGLSGEVLAAAGSLGTFKKGLHPGWPGMLPASFLFDSHGKLRYFWGGAAYEEELTPVLEALAQGRDVQGESRFDIVPGVRN